MSTTVANIAKAAMDNVSAAITDAILDVTLTWEPQGAYNFDTGEYATTTGTDTGRAVIDTVKPMTDIFPDYTVGPGDELVFLEGLTTAPQEGYTITSGATEWHIRQVQDIVGAGSIFYVIARKVL
jgi:hypothetical protein